MDFDFTDEQQQFRDALRRYLDNEYTFDARKKIIASEPGVACKALECVRRTRIDGAASAGNAGRLRRRSGRHVRRDA